MIVVDLDGFEYDFRPRNKRKNEKKSSGHLKFRKVLPAIFPTISWVEECPIKVRQDKTLYFDFYIPVFSLAVEINGDQHLKYNHFLHRNKLNFLNSQKNDELKKQFCEINNIRLVNLYYSESEEEWKRKIKNGF